MIKVSNLNKFYNKNHKNELHVINDTTLDLPETGLVSFLGESGSGKTTLLNTLGGLDRFDSGTISYEGLSTDKYNMTKIDSYRRLNIGYIFQNYNLLNDISVYDNLKVALEVINITDQAEQKRRIEYTLKAVGLYKFRRKLAYALSGGQQQRVSIARALVKESKVIIADEPTGNLDSANSIEIMNILKKISKKTLVLLVTHDKNLAEVYSDTIVELKDGKVLDIRSTNKDATLNHKDDNKIYLKDLNHDEEVNDNVSINYYHTTDEKFEFTLVEKNGTYYLKSNQKIKLVDDTNIELLDKHYEEIKKPNVDDFDFDTSWYSNDTKTNRFGLALNQFCLSFKSFFQTRKRTKFF